MENRGAQRSDFTDATGDSSVHRVSSGEHRAVNQKSGDDIADVLNCIGLVHLIFEVFRLANRIQLKTLVIGQPRNQRIAVPAIQLADKWNSPQQEFFVRASSRGCQSRLPIPRHFPQLRSSRLSQKY